MHVTAESNTGTNITNKVKQSDKSKRNIRNQSSGGSSEVVN